MKVAILCTTFFTFSGIDRVAEQQAKELTQNGNEVAIFTLKANMKPPENVKLQILGMPSNSLAQRVYRLLFPLDFVKAIRWVPKLKGFDAIYSHQYPLTWLAYLAKKNFIDAEFKFYDPIVRDFGGNSVCGTLDECVQNSNVVMFLTNNPRIINIDVGNILKLTDRPLLVIDCWHNLNNLDEISEKKV